MALDNAAKRAILLAARERIKDPAHWCQGAAARDVDGNPVENMFYTGAVSFGLDGAIGVEIIQCRVSDDDAEEFWEQLDAVVCDELGGWSSDDVSTDGSVAELNDASKHETVLAFLDGLIEGYTQAG